MKFSTQAQGGINTSPIQADTDHKTHMINIAEGVTQTFKAGHIVLVDESGVTGRWDGTLAALQLTGSGGGGTLPTLTADVGDGAVTGTIDGTALTADTTTGAISGDITFTLSADTGTGAVSETEAGSFDLTADTGTGSVSQGATAQSREDEEGIAPTGTGASEVGPPMLAIVVADQFEGDDALMCMRWGGYVADKRVVIADDTRVTAAARITLSRYGLFDKGTW